METDHLSRKLAVLLHADVAGSTALVQRNESLAHERIQDVFRRLSKTISDHHGIAHEIRGDALVAEFSKASDAVAAALAFQAANNVHNEGLSENICPELRVGVAMGEVVVADHTVTGEGIVLAQRLEQLADPGGVCIQGAAYETMPKRLPFHCENLGEQELKGFDEPVKVYAVRQETISSTDEESNNPDLKLEDKPSVAVLPLENMSGDAEQDYFADGMSEDIITSLSGISSLLVIARNSSFVYKGVARDIKQIGAELGARYVLEGSIRKSATRVRVTAQLIEAASGVHLWAQRYDRELEDVFELQDEITQTIVAAILPELEIAERNRAHKKTSAHLSSWENYQRGLWHGYKMTGEDANRAEEYFQHVLVDNPQYAPAMAGLAWIAYLRIILNFSTNEFLSRDELLEIGLRHAGDAVTADDKDAFAQYTYGRLLSLNGEFEESIERLNYAIAINPNYALAYHGLGYTLALGGRPADAIAQFDTALRLSPKDPFRWAFKTMRAYSLFQLKDYDNAVEWGRRAIRDNENMFWAYISVSSALGHLGRIDEAEKTFAGLLRVKPGFSSTTIDETVRFKNASDREHILSGLYKAGLKD